eukprot:scaffold649544_cov48-Prasinocladus_malaysianus.AAC.1
MKSSGVCGMAGSPKMLCCGASSILSRPNMLFDQDSMETRMPMMSLREKVPCENICSRLSM